MPQWLRVVYDLLKKPSLKFAVSNRADLPYELCQVVATPQVKERDASMARVQALIQVATD